MIWVLQNISRGTPKMIGSRYSKFGYSKRYSKPKVGTPNLSGTINGIKTEQYQLNVPLGTIPVYPFTTFVNGIDMDFEVVSATFKDKTYIYEDAPSNIAPFNMLYKNDGKGNNSANTGFFVYFKQGNLQSADFDSLFSLELLILY